MIRRTLRGLMPAALGLLLASPALAQSDAYDRYLNHQELSSAVRELASAHPNLVSLDEFARSDAGRELWKLTIGSGSADARDARPALLVVANLEGNHLIGSSAALHLARDLLGGYGQDDEITRLLDERTVYVIPRLNPDGAELVWSMPGYELSHKPHLGAPERGGMNVREIGADLNGDGMVTVMRVRDPAGTQIPHSEDDRLLREADRTRAERGLYRVYVEGIDPADEDAYVPMGSDGVNLNRNFPHEYLYYQPHVGPHQVSEVETRALADFMFEQVNVAAVLTFSPYDNLRSLPPENRRPPEGVAPGPPSIPTNILAQDRPFYRYISERFVEMTDLRGDGEPDEAGSFPQYAYFQVGIPSFTTPVWSPEPVVAMGGGGSSNGAAGSGGRDAQWLAHLDDSGVAGFIDWEEAEHPTLGTVEVGGFAPNARVNPPEAQIADLARRHAEFAVWLGNQLPAVEIVDSSVEPRGDHVYEVTATIANEQYLPTHLQMGTRIRTNRPVTARLAPDDGLTVLSGNTQQQIQRLEGMGGRHTFTWLVQAAPGTAVTLEVFAERAGGLQSTNLTLR